MKLFRQVYVLDKKKVSLFPREKLLSLALKSRGYSVNSIYELVPFRFWTLRSGFHYLLFPLVAVFLLFGINLSCLLLRVLLLISSVSFDECNHSISIYKLSLLDSVNKRNHFVLNFSSANQLIGNLNWIFAYLSFSCLDLKLLLIKGPLLLSIRETAFVIGDIFYNTETLITILALVKMKNLSTIRSNAVYFFSGIKSSSLFCVTNLIDLRNPIGPYGSEIHNLVLKRSQEIQGSLDLDNFQLHLLPDSDDFIFKGFVLYLPCVSDSFNFSFPSVYTSQVKWIDDVMSALSCQRVTVKIHPMSDGYGDTTFWEKLIKNLSCKHNVVIDFLPAQFPFHSVLDLGLYPLSPKGTVGLELIQRGLPALILGSNAWSALFEDLLVTSRCDYKRLIQECMLYSSLKPIYGNMVKIKSLQIAASLAQEDLEGFFDRLIPNRPFEELPNIRAGSCYRLGSYARSRDLEDEDTLVSCYDSPHNYTLLVDQFENSFSRFSSTPQNQYK